MIYHTLPAMFSIPYELIFFVLALIFGLFLFWRAGRHEFIDSELLFDSAIVSSIGALLVGRLFAFFLFWDKFSFSIYKLIFFNVYTGFNFYGALIGAIAAQIIYFSKKRTSFWQIFDLAAAPLVLAQSLVSFGKYLAGDKFSIYFASSYFLIYLILKRLANQKKHIGFFAHFYLVSTSLLNLGLSPFANNGTKSFGIFRFEAVISAVILLAASISWYYLSRRNISSDVKSFFGLTLLSLFRFARTLTSVREANEIARHIIFFPLYLVKLVLTLIRGLWQEFIGMGRDFMQALGYRK